jgi:HAD superfamily hydrolase (TIGR01509 family)
LHDAILFDFDGVLVDSEPVHHWAWSEILARYGVELPWASYCARCVGKDLGAVMEALAAINPASLSVEALRSDYPRKAALYQARMLESPPFFDQTIQLVKELNLPLAIVSSNSREGVEPILRAMDIFDCFSAGVFSGDVARAKPAPDPYLRAAELLGAKNPLVIEDSEAGCLSAEAAGFDFVRVDSPALVATRLRQTLNTY